MKHRIAELLIAGVVCFVGQTTIAANSESSTRTIQLQGIVLEAPLTGGINATRKDARYHPLVSEGPVKGWHASWTTNFVSDLPTNARDAGTHGFTYVVGFSNGFVSTIAALCDNHNDLTIVSEPNLLVSPGDSTAIPAGYQMPHYGSSYWGGAMNRVSEQDQLCEVAFSLNITATISPEGLIALDIHSIADKVTRIPEGPDIESASSHASVTLRSGDIILLGGAIRTFAAEPVFGGRAVKRPAGIRSLFYKSKVAPVSRACHYPHLF